MFRVLGLFGSVFGFEVVQDVYWVSGCLEFLVVWGFMSLQCLAHLWFKKSVFEVLFCFLIVSVAVVVYVERSEPICTARLPS